LCETHADAISILHEAGREPVARSVYGVWAGCSVERLMRAECTSEGWILHGELPNCAGVNSVDRALIVARLPEPMLFDVPRSALGSIEVETYRAVGMAAADSCSVHLERCQLPIDAIVGSPGFYTSRRGFWASALDVAACWLGGAVGVYRASLDQLSQPLSFDAHAQARLGAAFASLSAAGQVLHDAAHAIDAGESTAALQRRALWTRHVVEQSCSSVLDHMSRAVGDSPIRFDAAQARRIADLAVYLRQAQADRDLATLGELVGKIDDASWL
jgi:alkylation response protein AidB-like acyl-CoA dehydrogenase